MKTLLKLEGLALFGLSIFWFAQLGYAWWWYPLLFFVPDLSMLGYLGGTRVGAVDLVEHHHGRQMGLQGLLEHVAGLRQRAFARVDEEENAIIANGNMIRIIYADSPENVDYKQYGINDAILIGERGVIHGHEFGENHRAGRLEVGNGAGGERTGGV